MAHCQKGDNRRERSEGDTPVCTPLWLTPPGMLSGKSGHGAVGSRRPRKGRIAQQLHLGLTALRNECCYSSRGQHVDIHFKIPCKITTKTSLRLLSPWTTYFLSLSLKSRDASCIHALRKQENPAHPTVFWEAIQKGDHRPGHTAGLSPLGFWPSSFTRQLIAVWLASHCCTDRRLLLVGLPTASAGDGRISSSWQLG